MELKDMVFYRFNTIIVGSGAAGLNAAVRLFEMGQRDIAVITEGMLMGTSRNTGSDKQTYYKMTVGGEARDSVRAMAQTLFDGGCVDGDIALAEAAGSVRSFFHLVELGVPFPTNGSGEFVGYKTDHDPMTRGTSAGPYTSKFMTQALERRVRDFGIPVFDRHLAVRLLTSGEGEKKAAAGVMALNQAELANPEKRFTLFSATNVVWATGGEAGMYKASVYPRCQCGGSGALFMAGAKGKNLTESQYGIASTKFRWNLSGSFQQALPRYVSVDDQGCEREFLAEAFDSQEKMINAIFLKGYQWPFDPRKTFDEGSSYIDLLIYQEEVIRGRRVYMDYLRNPSALETPEGVCFDALNEETRTYLENCGALQDTPFERLKHINPAAIQVYLDHGIDLGKEKLEISICAQHNNGGIAGNSWWESEISHLFPVGEVNGSHGIYRPGGTALNAGQVGSMRAATYIARHYKEAPMEKREFLAAQGEAIAQVAAFADEAMAFQADGVDVRREIEILRERMTRYGACIRSREGTKTAIAENRAQMKALLEKHALQAFHQLPGLFRLMDLLTSQYVYLCAIADYIGKIGVSRGSYLIYSEQGELPHEGIDETFRNTTDGAGRDQIQEIRMNGLTGDCEISWRPVRPIPDEDQWFETVWQKYRKESGLC